MDLYLNITNDAEGLGLELEEKKEDLFQPKAGKPQLLVNRLLSVNEVEKCKTYEVSKHQSVGSLRQLTEISNVGCPLVFNHKLVADPRTNRKVHERCVASIHRPAVSFLGAIGYISGIDAKLLRHLQRLCDILEMPLHVWSKVRGG
jgi:hypothetical protein